ncbi:hypothetical protein C8Q74DRAFT_1371199 [Fomes fomentarius]|nr:hypothetical protein C8Q74DRAFT_1371199 [Fomes fomentarius]
MASIFSNNRILPTLKRRSRSTNKSDARSASPAIMSKVIHILPNVAEEEESPSRHSCSSVSSLPAITRTYQPQPSRSFGGSATLGGRPSHDKRDSRRVVLTGVEGLTFDDFFPPSSAPRVRTPSPPPRPITPPRSVTSSPTSEAGLDDINLRFSGLGISLDFPSPPSSAISFSPLTLSRRREQSPTPSTTSSEASTASPKTPCSTPPTSDDECHSSLMRAPTFKSQHASVLFMNSMPDLIEPVRKSSISSFVEEDVSEDVEWIAREIGDIVTLASPVAPASPLSPSFADFRARPDSMPPPPRNTARGRTSKVPPLPRISIQDSSARGPSAQLDPTFPLKRRSYLVPSRPPPPPPMPKSPGLSAMEQATEELLAELANAALGAGFLGTELTVPHDAWSNVGSVPPSPSSHFIVTSPASPCPSGLRPPPRSSVPADILDICESPVELVLPKRDQWPVTPLSSVSFYSQATDSSAPASPLSSFDFDIDVTFVQSDSQCSPVTQSPTPIRRSPSTLSMGADPERTLRSRWSTSTLGSLAETHSHSWLPRFTLSPSKRAKKAAAATATHSHSSSHSSSSSSSPTSPLQRKNAVKGSHVAKRSMDSDSGAGVSRRDSRSSRVSESSASDSGDSTASAGLRRKPIPMALLSVTGPQTSMMM